MSFSELLKQCRKQKGISQAELASKLGVTQQAVGKWESGKSSPFFQAEDGIRDSVL